MKTSKLLTALLAALLLAGCSTNRGGLQMIIVTIMAPILIGIAMAWRPSVISLNRFLHVENP